MEAIIEITDKFGHRRRARKGEVPTYGETIHFPATLMDAMAHALADATAPDPTIRDSYGAPAGHRPGYAFATDAASLRATATQAYEDRCARLHDAWRQRPITFGQNRPEVTMVPALDAEQSRTQAETAYQDKCARISNQWRTR